MAVAPGELHPSGLADQLGDYDDYASDEERQGAVEDLEEQQQKDQAADDWAKQEYENWVEGGQQETEKTEVEVIEESGTEQSGGEPSGEEAEEEGGEESEEEEGDSIIGNDQPIPYPGLWAVDAQLRMDAFIVARLQAVIDANSFTIGTYLGW